MTPPVLEKCPVCRARFQGDELREQPCRRCGSDLGHVRNCYSLAAQYQEQAQIALAQGEIPQALELSANGLKLVDDSSMRQTHQAARLAEFLATIRSLPEKYIN